MSGATEHYDRASYERIKSAVLDDAYLFAVVVCGHTDLSPETHRPLIYAAAGQGDKLIAILDDDSQRSFTIRHLRQRFLAANADWRTESGRQRFFELLNFLNIRVFRGSAKSSALVHAVTLYKATLEPNLSQVIITGSDRKAKDELKRLRNTILSDIYGAVFPERLPANPTLELTETALRLGGRTRPDREPSIMAFGYKSGVVGYHFDRFVLDDLVTEENRSPIEIQGALDYMSNLTGLYNPGKRYPIQRLHVGTRWDEEDDDAFLRKSPRCLSIDIPIEVYRDGRPENITQRGIPTCPEWADSAKIDILQQDTLGDELKGPWYWRANYLLDPTAVGGRLFSRELIEEATWQPVKARDNRGIEKTYIGRPHYDPKTKEPVMVDEDNQRVVLVDPRRLFVSIGADQAFSEADSADEWAVTVVGEDPDGYYFQLETRAGKGYEAMLEAILALDETYKARKIGLEKAAMQGATHFWMDRSRQFKSLKPKLIDIPHNNKSKEWRINNAVAEPMRMHQLFLSPASVDLHSEMILYRGPGPKAKDNRMDSLAIALSAAKRPAAGEEIQSAVRRYANRREQRRDTVTGIYVG